MEDELCTATGKKIPTLHLKATHFLDKTGVLYGPTKSGKTVFVKHIMKLVSCHIEQILVISPSESSNRSYQGIVPAPLIHYRLWLPDPKNPKKDDGAAKGAARFLEAVWSRQEMMASIYTRANNINVLLKLFKRIPKKDQKRVIKFVNRLDSKRRKVLKNLKSSYVGEESKQEEKINDINDKFKHMLVLIYKKYISKNYENIVIGKLSQDEKYSLHYINFNPRLLLIFDDCAAQLKPLFSKDIFRKLFYQNRHSYITCLVCCQDDTDLPANLRRNALVSIFTTAIVASSNFQRNTNKFDKPTKQYVEEIIPEVYKGHRKLAYLREDDTKRNFYHVTATYSKSFRFGSNALWELCEMIQSEGTTMDKENPYYDTFRLD